MDLAGNETPLNPISVVVDNIAPTDINPPTVIILSPVAGQELSGTIDIEVMANDNTGINYIEFFIN